MQRRLGTDPTGPQSILQLKHLVLHAALRKEVHGVRNELNSMLTGCMNAMRTTQNTNGFCCTMIRRMDKRDRELAEAEKQREGGAERAIVID